MALTTSKLSHDLLFTLVTFQKTGSMSATAIALGISQPAVSIRFSNIKAVLKSEILVRRGSSYELTPYAQALAKAVTPLFADIEQQIKRTSLFHKNPANMELNVGGRKELFGHLAGLAQYPGRIIFHDVKSSQAVSMLLENKLDIALSQRRPNVHHIKVRKLFAQSTRLIVHRKWIPKTIRADHQLALNERFVTETPWIVYNRQAGFIHTWLRAVKLKEQDLFIKAEAQDWTTVVNLVKNGLGFAFVPTGVSSGGPNVLEIPIPEQTIPSRRFYLLYHAHLSENLPLKKQLDQLFTS